MEPLRRTDPRRIGPYEVLARLGSGGMGQVFLARSRAGRHVAIKLVQEGFAGDPEFRARFKREVAAARAVSGAFTAPVIDADPDARVPWLATAFLPGLSLQRAVAEGGPMPISNARVLGANLAEALVAIHRAGVVHRDLKPSNVLLTPDGPRVIDFGIARAADATAVTRTGSVIGSPGYMAPEQATGGDAGPAGDVFALGAVLTYAVTGRGPFGQGPADVLLYRVVHDQPDLSGVDDAELRDLIAACLDKRPDRRPAPDLILARLAPFSSGTVAPWGTRWPQGRDGEDVVPRTALLTAQPGPGRRTLLTAAGGVLALGVAAFGATRYLLGGEQEAAPQVARPEPPTPSALPAGVIWSTKLPRGRPLAAPIAVAGDLIFATTADNGTHVLDAESGEVRWRAELQPEFLWPTWFRPLVRNGIAYLQDGSAITAYDAASGRVRWTRPLRSWVRHASPIAAGGRVVSCSAKEVVAYDPASGDLRWTWPSPGHLHPELMPYGGAVIAETEHAIVSLDAGDGRERWKHELPGPARVLSDGPVLADGRIYVGEWDGSLRAVDARTGKLSWRAHTARGEPRLGRRPVVAGRTVYLQGTDELLYAFEADTGKLRWKARLAGDEEQRRAIESGRLVPVTAIGLAYVNDCNDNLLALDNSTGRIRWRQPIPGAPSWALPVIKNKTLHIATGKDIRSFDLETGRISQIIPFGYVGILTAGENALYARTGNSLAALRPAG